jgi:cell wall-associated NlpC family hydrolase
MNKKHIAILGTATVILVSCTSSIIGQGVVLGNTRAIAPSNNSFGIFQQIIHSVQEKTISEEIDSRNKSLAEAKAVAQEILNNNTIDLFQRIKDSKGYIGVTPYVFGESSTSGWDCSGFVRWFYKDLGLDLPHSATKQGNLEPKSRNPIIGDVVVFKYNGAENYVHSAIYIGNNEVLHSGFRSGDKTSIISLDSPAFKGQSYYFVTLIETNYSVEETSNGQPLSDDELVEVLKEVGFSGSGLRMAWAIVVKESTSNPDAHNQNKSTGDNSYGLFQINMINSLGPSRLKDHSLSKNEDLFDPTINAKVAFEISEGGTSWKAWTTHKDAKKLAKQFPG